MHEKLGGLGASVASFFHRKYRTVDAVKAVSFSIEADEIVGFLGPNGAGKTTTLKAMSGLLLPTGGTVEIRGHTPWRREREFLQTISLVMGQKQQLTWDLPASDSFLLNKAFYDIKEGDFKARLQELTAVLDLANVVNRPVRKLSLGERMKCEIVAALLHRPEIIFLDEPTIGLDVETQETIRQFFAEYRRRHGATIVLTSHYMADIEALARRVIIIDRGHLVFDGLVKDLANQVPQRRLLSISFSEPIAADRLQSFGVSPSSDGRSASIEIESSEVVGRITQALARFPISDIAIGNLPLEKVIRQFLASRGGKSDAS